MNYKEIFDKFILLVTEFFLQINESLQVKVNISKIYSFCKSKEERFINLTKRYKRQFFIMFYIIFLGIVYVEFWDHISGMLITFFITVGSVMFGNLSYKLYVGLIKDLGERIVIYSMFLLILALTGFYLCFGKKGLSYYLSTSKNGIK